MNAWIDGLLNYVELIQLFRILLAVVLGSVIGFEREKYGRPAGLRTHMIVTSASALAMLVSMYGFESGDPARLAAQVISGIGFIGAGAIIRGDKDITGITTAATIFMCAIIGLACGNGSYFGAIITTLFSLLILTCLTSVEAKLSRQRRYKSNVSVIVKYEEDIVDRVKAMLDNSNIVLNSIDYKNTTYEGEKVIKINLIVEKHALVKDLNKLLADIDKEFSPLQCKITNESYTPNRKYRD